jgi:hypothetical protein
MPGMSSGDRLVDHSKWKENTAGSRDGESSLGDMQNTSAVPKTRKVEGRMSAGKVYPWVEDEYPLMIGHCNPALAEAVRQRELAEKFIRPR